MIRVLIVAPYASVRAGLHALLDGADSLLVVGEAGGAADLERVLPQARPNVVLLDESGPADTARVREVLALTGNRDDADEEPVGLVSLAAPGGGADGGDTATPLAGLRAALDGGWAYLSKEADGQEIAAAVRAAAVGLIVLDRGSLSPLLALAATHNTPPDGAPPGETPVGETLTAREREVLQLMAQGLPNKIIAARLGISLHTAKFHVASILAKLNAASRTEAVTLGARRGLVVL